MVCPTEPTVQVRLRYAAAMRWLTSAVCLLATCLAWRVGAIEDHRLPPRNHYQSGPGQFQSEKAA